MTSTICAGTSKVAESYIIGTRTTNIVLEILNLNKKEVIPINEISNQEFSEVNGYFILSFGSNSRICRIFFRCSLLMVNVLPICVQDECKRLRQSIKYGFSKRLTVVSVILCQLPCHMLCFVCV